MKGGNGANNVSEVTLRRATERFRGADVVRDILWRIIPPPREVSRLNRGRERSERK